MRIQFATDPASEEVPDGQHPFQIQPNSLPLLSSVPLCALRVEMPFGRLTRSERRGLQADEPEVAGVCTPRDVEEVAHDGDEAHDRVNGDIEQHQEEDAR